MPEPTYGPDRSPRPARFRPPAGACDVHAHIFGPTSRFPYAEVRPYTPPEAPFEEYMRMHEVLGIERGVLTPPRIYGTDNSALLDALDRGAPNLRGVVAMAPEDLADVTIARLDARGVRGVRINRSILQHLEAIAERIAGAGWYIEIAPENIESVVALRSRLEKLPCPTIFDQMARLVVKRGPHDPAFQTVIDMLRASEIWIKLSHAYHLSEAGPPYADILPFAQALVEANPGRCLWGSVWPHPSNPWPVPNDGMVLDLLADWVPEETVRNRILVDNPAALNRF